MTRESPATETKSIPVDEEDQNCEDSRVNGGAEDVMRGVRRELASVRRELARQRPIPPPVRPMRGGLSQQEKRQEDLTMRGGGLPQNKDRRKGLTFYGTDRPGTGIGGTIGHY